MFRVTIELDFEEHPCKESVENRLNHLMEKNFLYYATSIPGEAQRADSVCGWSIADVYTKADELQFELTEDEAEDVLYKMEKYFDASLGMTWDDVEMHIEDVVKERGAE